VGGEDLLWKFTSDSSVNGWGFRFKVHAIMPLAGPQGRSTDRRILSRPSMDVVISLLDRDLITKSIAERRRELMLRLAAALAAAAQVSNLNSIQRMWALQKLRKVIWPLTSEESALTTSPSEEPTPFFTNCKGLIGIPDLLLRQYEYEEPILRTGKHLMFSPFLKV
jgi:E3 ubiquitin-protein ligase HERC2